jgi:isopentenyl diphosphate isomerase/L-lactate dehydrogenase-like FMN-dependent dehydrogenase
MKKVLLSSGLTILLLFASSKLNFAQAPIRPPPVPITPLPPAIIVPTPESPEKRIIVTPEAPPLKVPSKSSEAGSKQAKLVVTPASMGDVQSSVRSMNDKLVNILKQFGVKQIAANDNQDTVERLIEKLEQNVTALEAVFKNIKVDAK